MTNKNNITFFIVYKIYSSSFPISMPIHIISTTMSQVFPIFTPLFITLNPNNSNKILLFDGVCNLCNGTIQFIIERDQKNLFQFASLQSNFGQKILIENEMDAQVFKSFIYLENNKIYTKSTAALKVFEQLPGAWRAMKIFWIFPAFLRNWVYDFIAKNRYRWFGKQESCWLPTPELQSKFIDQ